VHLIVIAKAPVPGRSKTRLTPPCTPEEAAEVAGAALADTLAAVAAVPDVDPVLVLDGEPGGWVPDGFRVVPQRGDGLDERLASAFDDVGGPGLLIGMDTPQVTPDLLSVSLARLRSADVDAVLGPARDGGWWAIGLRCPDPRVFLGVPMSTAGTCHAQRARLRELGLTFVELEELRDVDTFDDAIEVAGDARATRFAETVGRIREGVGRATVSWVGIAAALIAVVVSYAGGRALQGRGYRMQVNAPPLTGNIDPRVSWSSLPSAVLAVAAVGWADRVAVRVPWRALLGLSFLCALGWSVSLAAWDGVAGFTRGPASAVDYLQALPLVDGVGAFLDRLVTDPSGFPSHVRSHPPGMVLLLLGAEGLGLATPGWLAVLEHGAGAASVPAVLLVTRELAGERTARIAAPFVALSSIAVFWSSGDAVFLGIGAWAVALLVLATGRTGRRATVLALGAGLLWAAALALSYGIVLLAAVPVTIAVARRRGRLLVVAAAPVVVTALAAGAAGFWWLDGLSAARRAYAVSLARVRPYGYFLLADLAALAVAVGPVVWAWLPRARGRAGLLAAGAVVAIVVADLTGLSKGEVERIWLPFMPWLVAAAAAVLSSVPAATRRTWLAVQLGWALVVQAVVFSPW
jgi:rSAM/selenodomain-associated transferase 1